MKASLAAVFVLGTSLIAPVQAQEPVITNIRAVEVDDGDLGISSTAEFRAEVLQADAASIAASRLALQRSHDPDIRDYAERVIATRKATSAALLPEQPSLDTSGNLSPDPSQLADKSAAEGVRVTLGSAGRARVDRLKAAPSADSFDRDFAEQQARSDARTLTLYTSYARNGDSEEGRRFANEALPWIAAQLDRSNILQARYRS